MLDSCHENGYATQISDRDQIVDQATDSTSMGGVTNIPAQGLVTVGAARNGTSNCRIPNAFMRTLHEFAGFLESQGSDSRQRLVTLLRNCDSMGPSSREAAAQVLDFVMAVLSPLSEALPPYKRRERASLD